MRHRVAHRKLGRVTESIASRCCGTCPRPFSGTSTWSPRCRAPGTAAVRRTADHDCEAWRGRQRREGQDAQRPSPRHAGPAGPRSGQQAVRHACAPFQGRRAVTPACCASAIAAATRRKSPRSNSSAVSSTRAQPPRKNPQGGRRSCLPKGVGGRLRAAADRLRGTKKDEATPRRRPGDQAGQRA